MADLVALSVADEPAAWAGVGFAVADDGRAVVGGVSISLVGRSAGSGIVAWTLDGVSAGSLDGLATTGERRDEGDGSAASGAHPNGAVGLDHVVVFTPAFARTRDVLVGAGFDLRREVEMRGTSMGFFRIGPTILELVATPDGDPADPARFWGLVVVLPDLDDVHPGLAEHLGEPRDAVQPGRRIATLRETAGISPALAFMTPR